MKKLIPLLLLLVSCHKPIEDKLLRTFGATGNPDRDYATLKKGRGRPVKDTVVTDTTTQPTDTAVTPLPTSYQLWMPPVMNQGSEGACHSFAVAFARSAENYYKTGVQITLSPEYMFNQVETGNCASSALLTNLNLLVTKGVCTLSSMPYSWLNGCSLQPTVAQDMEAAQYRIKGYEPIAATDITGIKKAISENHPLVIQIVADQRFLDARPGFVWTTFSGAVGSHGVVICGYDDTRQAVKIINSWGTTWGDAGYSWIAYALLPTVSSSAFKLIVN